ncbi:MAG: cysteine--tRNA ligase [Candidatus Dormiibacterota bacterium]
MTQRLYNSMSERVEEFVPLVPGNAGMYTCGPTVHDRAQIGNLRTFLAEDLLRRQLEHQGLVVTQVMNITDVDDKIIKKASAAGRSLEEYTAPFIAAFFRDLELLAVEPAASYPRATKFIPQMLALVSRLVERGSAYVRDGSVYFRISSFPAYGKLSHLDTAGLRSGASGRVDEDEYEAKEQVRDFALWKAGRKGDLAAWPSPYGWGRPGWHLECSAMSMDQLGETFDIHCGGVDNKFPHHENEIAQSEAATGVQFVRYWVHAEHLLVGGVKMAKSLGNFVTLETLVERGHDPMAVRFLLLTGAHYRHKLQFQEELLQAAEQDVSRLAAFWRRCLELQSGDGFHETGELGAAAERSARRFDEAMEDDLSLPDAVAATFELVREGNRLMDAGKVGPEGAAAALSALRSADTRLAVVERRALRADALSSEERELLEQREQARRERDFALSDRLRDQLLELGIQLEDTKAGTRWRRA